MVVSQPVNCDLIIEPALIQMIPQRQGLIIQFIRAELHLWPNFQKYSGVQVSMIVRTFPENQQQYRE
jgi:hypothetical protein